MADETLEIIITATDKASSVLGGIGKGFSGLADIGKKALLPMLGLATAGFGALATGIGFAIGEAIEAQEIQAQLNAVLQSTGGVAGVTAQMANQLADSFSQVTRYSDEAVLGAENVLLTFTNIGQDVFPDTLGTVLDMSQALGLDLQQAAIQVGKAIQDPILGVSALRRVGVNFSEDQQDVIASLVESGNVMEAQKLILAELQTEFGGSAEAAGQTFAGQLDILKNSLSNVAEGIGTALLPVGQQLINDFILPIVPMIEDFGAKFGNLIAIVADAGITSIEAKEALGAIFGEDMATKIQDAIFWFTDLKDTLFAFVQETVIPFVEEHKDALIGAFVAIGAAIAVAGIASALIAIVNPVTLLIAAIGLLAAAWVEDWGGIRTFLTAFWGETLQPIVSQLFTWLQTNIPLAIQALSEFWTNTLQPALANFWNWVQTTVFPLFQTLWDWLQTNIPLATQTLSDFWTGTLQPALELVWGFVQESLFPLFTALKEFFEAAFTLALTALAGLWENVLLPALTKVWDFISVTLQPVLQGLSDFFQNTIGPVIANFAGGDFLGTLATALENISTAVQTIIDKLIDFKNKLLNLSLPDWLTPGSPTPFEIGLQGIRRELESISLNSLPGFNAALDIGRGSVQTVSNNTYNLSINTRAPYEPILDDFAMMRSLAG